MCSNPVIGVAITSRSVVQFGCLSQADIFARIIGSRTPVPPVKQLLVLLNFSAIDKPFQPSAQLLATSTNQLCRSSLESQEAVFLGYSDAIAAKNCNDSPWHSIQWLACFAIPAAGRFLGSRITSGVECYNLFLTLDLRFGISCLKHRPWKKKLAALLLPHGLSPEQRL